MARSLAVILITTLFLGACSTGRWGGPMNCSADGSPVWWEYPNSKGSYEGLNNGPQNCRK